MGDAETLIATTPVPVAHPEQKIDSLRIETEGCEALARGCRAGHGRLVLTAGSIAQGDVISAIAHYRLTLTKQSHKYERDRFPARQKPPVEVNKGYLQDSPGIQTSSKHVRTLAAE